MRMNTWTSWQKSATKKEPVYKTVTLSLIAILKKIPELYTKLIWKKPYENNNEEEKTYSNHDVF